VTNQPAIPDLLHPQDVRDRDFFVLFCRFLSSIQGERHKKRFFRKKSAEMFGANEKDRIFAAQF
jgi:hypothetical protein